MKTLLLLLVVILCSCSPRSRILPQPLGVAEKVVIIDNSNTHVYGGGYLSYKIRRISTKTVTFIQISYNTIYSKGDTLLWKF